jgi:hypothetical protein
MVWNELDRRVKEKQPTSAQNMCELLQDCWKSIKLVERIQRGRKSVKAKGGTLNNQKYIKICLTLFFGHGMIPYVLFNSFDVFTIILPCRKEQK